MNDVNAYIGRMNFSPVTEEILKVHMANGNYYNKALKDIKDVELKWNQIINVIDQNNPKTSSFLSDATIHSLDNEKLILSILNGSQFHINSLENDINIINESFSKILGKKINISFQIKSDESVKREEDKPEQHPLLDKAIDFLDGEIIDNK